MTGVQTCALPIFMLGIPLCEPRLCKIGKYNEMVNRTEKLGPAPPPVVNGLEDVVQPQCFDCRCKTVCAVPEIVKRAGVPANAHEIKLRADAEKIPDIILNDGIELGLNVFNRSKYMGQGAVAHQLIDDDFFDVQQSKKHRNIIFTVQLKASVVVFMVSIEGVRLQERSNEEDHCIVLLVGHVISAGKR